jgi:hypothetical protein
MGYLNALLGYFTEDDEPDELEQLYQMLQSRQQTLGLEAQYGRPYPNTTNEPTVDFPYTLYTAEGEEYGAGVKEFVLPDNGLDDHDSNLVQFVAAQHGIDANQVTFDDVAAVEGEYDTAELTDSGDVVITHGDN